MENKRKKIIFDISEELHRDIKITAAKRNISMSLWMNRTLQQKIEQEKKYVE